MLLDFWTVKFFLLKVGMSVYLDQAINFQIHYNFEVSSMYSGSLLNSWFDDYLISYI